MPIIPSRIENPQQIEVVVGGPDEANRLFIVTGTALFMPFTGDRATVRFLVGPKLTPAQFHRAIATAGLAGIQGIVPPGATIAAVIESADADWDEESGQTEIQVEFLIIQELGITSIGYQVTILAKV